METTGENPLARVKRFFDRVAVVAVDIDVEHAGERAEELEDAEDDIVDVAEPARAVLLRVVEPAGPVDRDVGRALGECRGRTDRTPCRDGAELERALVRGVVHPGENCAVFGSELAYLVQTGQTHGHFPPFSVSSAAVSGVTRLRKWMYSSEWNLVISSGSAGVGLCSSEEETVVMVVRKS